MSLREAILHRLTSRRNPNSLSGRMRRKRLQVLYQMIVDYHSAVGHVRIIDVGGTQRYWKVVSRSFLENHGVHITLVNTEPDEDFLEDQLFDTVYADGCNLGQFGDKSFNIGHSNSVIEHVTSLEMMERFAGEMRRVSQSLFIQTPNYWFPIETHFVFPFFHLLPRPVRVFFRRHLNMGYYLRAATKQEAEESVDSIDLLTARRLQRLFPDCRIVRYRFLMLTKSLVALRNSIGVDLR